jgi:hypothetical protein
LKHSSWIEALLLPPAVAVLNTAWVSLWVLWSVRAVPPEVVAAPVSPLLLALLLLCGFAITRASLAAQHPPLDPRLPITLCGLVLVLGAGWLTYGYLGPLGFWRALVDWGNFISPAFLGVAACAFLWFQGIQLGRSHLPQEDLEHGFYGGILGLGLLFAVNQLRPLITTAESLTAALAFFATGLAALALVSIENARRAEHGLTGSWPALSRYWLGTVASVIGSILLAGLLVAGLLSPDTFQKVAYVVETVVDAVTLGILFAAGFMTFAVAWLLAPVVQLFARAVGQVNFHLPVLPNFQQVSLRTLAFFAQHPALNFARRGLVLGVIIAALGLLFWWAVRRFARRKAGDSDETRESIASRELLMAQIKNLFTPRRRAALEPAYLSLSGSNDDPRLMVRRAYQAMLEWAASLSLPTRHAGETPAAYAAILRDALPEGGPAIETLTGAYVQARYAADAPSMDVARAAISAINQLRVISGQLKRTGRGAG